MNIYPMTQTDILLNSKKTDYLLYAIPLGPRVFELKIVRLTDEDKDNFLQFDRECYSNRVFCAERPYLLSLLQEAVDILATQSVDLEDPVELAVQMGGTVNGKPLPYPKRS